MASPTQEHRLQKLRLERIRSKYGEFGISTDVQLFTLVRDKAGHKANDATDVAKRNELNEICLWTPEQCRQCMVVRGGTRYRTFIDLVCQVLADIDVSPDSNEEKYRRYAHFIWTLGSAPTADSPATVPSAELDEFPFAKQLLPNSPTVDADQFYNASPQGLAAIVSDLDILREVYQGTAGVRSTVIESLSEGPSRLIALNGTAGSGKSVLLDRLIVEAVRGGYQVFRCNTALVDPNILFSKLLELKAKSTTAVLFVFDDCYRMFARGVMLSSFFQLDLIAAAGPPVVIVLSDNWYIRAEGEAIVANFVAERKAMHNVVELSRPEIEDLVDKLYAAEQGGAIKEIRCALPRQERLNLLASRRDRLAIIVLLKLRYGKNIVEIMKEEYESIQPAVLRDVYRDVVVLNAIGTGAPHHLVRRHITSQPVEGGATKTLAALFSYREDGVYVRHPALISPLLRAIYPGQADRSLALSSIIRSLNLKNAADREFWYLFATRPGSGRSIFRLLSYQKETMKAFVDDMHTMEQEFLQAELGASFFGFLGTIYKDVLFELESGLSQFVKSHEIDNHNPFVIRQLAWSTLKLGRVGEAEAYCREAVSKWSDDARTLSDAAFIMSWCSKAGFDDADNLYKRAIELAPADKDIIRKWERYKEAASIGRFIVGDELSDTVLEEIGAPSFIWRVRRHARRQYSRALFRELSGNLRKDHVDLEDIEETVASAKGVSDKRLSGLVQANIARAEYERWYHFGDDIDVAGIKRRFEIAVERCPNDPFIHCWFGTFLKEVENDYDGAEQKYESARSLAKGSRAEFIVEHPMILNNIALLIMDGVYRQLRKAERLKEAYSVLDKAIERMVETGSEFRWPISTMEQLRQQATEFKIELPNDK